MKNMERFHEETQGRRWDVTFDRMRPIPFVKHCGRSFGDITDRNELYTLSSELNEMEKESPYARYYALGPACPSEENIRATEYDTLIDADQVFMVEDFAKKMDIPGCSELKPGYCILPNGVGFCCATTMVPGCTAEVMTNFIENFNPPQDLYYKIWLPGSHVRHYEDMAVEDVGFGMAQLKFIEGLTSEKIGMPQPPLGDQYNIGITGANILCTPLHQPEAEPIHVSELCYYRLTPEGYELRVVFWVGMHFENGKSVLHLPKGKPVDAYYPAALARHSVWETATFMRNVMQFWADTQKGAEE